MQYGTLALLACATLASAVNQITFVSMDDNHRRVIFTANSDRPNVDPVEVPGGENVTVTIPEYWVGNFYSIMNGTEDKPGMLGEVAYQAYNKMIFFDVSGIVNPHDNSGVFMMFPADTMTPMSGCMEFMCNTLYINPDDVQTKVTRSTHLITTLGAGNPVVYKSALATRDVNERVYPRAAVTDPNWTPERLHSRHVRL